MNVKVYSGKYLVFIGFISTETIKKYQQSGFVCEEVPA